MCVNKFVCDLLLDSIEAKTEEELVKALDGLTAYVLAERGLPLASRSKYVKRLIISLAFTSRARVDLSRSICPGRDCHST